MATCTDCKQQMSDMNTDSCTLKTLEKEGQTYNRDTTYYDFNDRCHDCNIKNVAGNYHHLGCDIEQCPKCGGQLISCGCFEF